MKPILLLLLALGVSTPLISASTPAGQPALKFGMHEIVLTGKARPANPFDTVATVRFTPPSGAIRAINVPAFHDGGDTWRARVYVSETGAWTWASTCDSDPGLHAQSGSFTATDSRLRGRLLVHPKNPRQWITEDGRWFLNLNDTAYFLLSTHDGHGGAIPFEDFTAYVKDATDRGITSFRSFVVSGPKPFHENNSGRHRWLEFFTDATLTHLRLDGLQETDRRLRWLLEHHPDVAMQLILFPLERWKADGVFWQRMTAPQRERLLRHLLARYAAFPQIFWLLINDAHYAPVRSAPRPNEAEGTGTSVEFPNNLAFAREVGSYIHRHDPWQHPLSTGPARTVPFHFENEPWATYIHLEDNFDLGAAGMEKYRAVGKPVFLGEDRYEQDRPERDPDDMRYFQRRLFWSWLLAGGSANYGGRWWVVQPYTQTGVRSAKGAHGGNPPPVFSRQLVGLDSVRVLRDYFSERRIELSDFEAAPGLVRDAAGRKGPQAPKLMRRGNDELLIYHPNADSADKTSRVSAKRTARLHLDLAGWPGQFRAEWFRAADGATLDGGTVNGGDSVDLMAPWAGHDVVLRLLRSSAQAQTPAAAPLTFERLRHTLIQRGAGLGAAERDALLQSLEARLLQPPYDRDPDTVRHFREMCDHAIADIAGQTGETAGVKIWKFYSSGYVCRSGNTVFAFDLNQGVNAKRWTPAGETGWTPPPKTPADFVMTDVQIARLAPLIDVAFYSHEDEDHVCHAFMDALVKAGKTVVVTEPVARLPGYRDLAGALTILTPESGRTYSFGALKVEGLATRQVYADPKRRPVLNNLYLVTTPTGQVVMHKGDANVGDEAWRYFEAYAQRGGKIDLYLGGYSPFGTKDRDPTGCADKIHRTFDDFVIPGHMYEWSHLQWGVKGVLTYDKVMKFDGARILAGRGIVLSWGESYTHPAKLDRKR